MLIHAFVEHNVRRWIMLCAEAELWQVSYFFHGTTS